MLIRTSSVTDVGRQTFGGGIICDGGRQNRQHQVFKFMSWMYELTKRCLVVPKTNVYMLSRPISVE